MLLVAVVSLPDSFLRGRGSSQELLVAAMVILAATGSFYFVQGSDPGFLSPGKL